MKLLSRALCAQRAALVAGILVAALLAPWSVFAVGIETPGSTDAQFAVTPDGGTAYSVPIRVPPGTAGVEPKLALSYSSRGGPSAVGFGWAVSGLSAVQRGSRNKFEDGAVRGVYLDEKDALYLDGEKLIQVSTDANASFREFRTRVDNYSRIRAYEWDAKGPKRLTVETRAGLRLHFGSAEASRVRVDGTGPILTWLCDRIEDSVGNFMLIAYAVEGLDHRIAEISYTGNNRAGLLPYAKVSFSYKQVDPYEVRYLFGTKIEQKYLLDRITTSFRAKTHRTYTFEYDRLDKFRKAFQLAALRELGSDGLTYRPLRFVYSRASGNWREYQDVGFPSEVAPLPSGRGLVFANIDGDARQELIYRFVSSGVVKAGAYSYATGTPKPMDGKWTPLIDLTGDDYLLHDLDADGHADIVATGPASYLASQKEGWLQVSNAGLAFNLKVGDFRDNRYLFINTDPGGKRGDALIWASPRQSTSAGAALVDGNAWRSLSQFQPPHLFEVDASNSLNGVYALDVDCDGRQELVYNLTKADGSKMREVYKATSKGWELFKDSAYLLPFDPVPHSAALRVVDLNADGCKDIVVAYRSAGTTVQKAWLATSKGWKEDPRAFPDVVFWTGQPGTVGRMFAEMADLSGDGRADLFWGASTGSALKAGAYRSTSTDWVFDKSLAPPAALPGDPNDRQRQFAVINLTGSTVPQLAYVQEKGLPEIYTNSRDGWAIDKELRVPLTVAQFDKADLGVRFPDLNGDGFADIAYTKKLKDGKLEKVAYVFSPGATRPWKPDARYKLPRPTFSEDLKDTGVFLVDFNGDGLTDLLYAYQPSDASKPPVVEAFVNCSFMTECKEVKQDDEGGYWKSVTDPIFGSRLAGYVPPIPFTQEGIGSLGVRALDLNGDGLTDLIASREEDDPTGASPPKLVRRVFLNQLDSSTRVGRWVEVKEESALPPIAFVRPLRTALGELENTLSKVRDNRVELIDLDGDRLPDILYSFKTWAPKPETDDERRQRVLEGKPSELIPTVLRGAFLNWGDSWVPAPAYTPSHRFDQDESQEYEQARSATQTYFQDINSDGLVDLIYAERCDSPCSAVNEAYLNSGSGWARYTAYDVPSVSMLNNTKGDQGFRFMDVNADGLVDIVYHRVLDGGVIEKGAQINSGLGWAQSNEKDDDPNRDGYAPPIAFVEVGRGDLGIRPLDLNGDGIVDLVQTYKRSDSEQVNRVWLNQPFAAADVRPFKTDLLAEVTDGLGKQTRIQYRSLIGVAFDQGDGVRSAFTGDSGRSPAYPILDPPMPGYVVTTLEVSGPGVPARTSNYRYGGYRVNTLTGRSLGFGLQEIEDVERRRKTTVRYLQADGVVGNVANTKIEQAVAGKRVQISLSKSRYSVSRIDGAQLSDGFRTSFLRARLDETSSESRDLTGSPISFQTDVFRYDDNGNPVSIRTSFADGSGSETTNTYFDDLGRWHLGRLATASVTLFSPGKPSQTREAAFRYESTTGQLMREVSLVGTIYEASTDYERDSFGNKVASATTVKTGEPSRRTIVAYDALGRFAISTTNQLGHTSRAEFDEVSGAITAKYDANGIRQTARYDSLQRLRSETDTSGVVTLIETAFSNGGAAAFSVTKRTGELPPTTTLHDASGLPRRQVFIGFEGKKVVVDYEYDRLGRLISSSVPRFEGDAVLRTVRRYDALDRVIEEQRPDGAIVGTRYQGLRIVAIDPLGRETAIERDARGRTVKTIDPNSGETTFAYDASGKPIEVTNALGQVSRASYNLAGQRNSLDDPALGLWRYRYNGFSELIEQVDARGDTVALRYDGIGRLIERKSRTDVAHYYFDEGANAVGRLTSVRSSQSAGRDIAYDGYGRVGSVRFRVGNDEARVEQTYDSLSRPVERRYSSGFSVENMYDEHGNWRQVLVTSHKGSSAAWRSLQMDALGRVTQEQLGNGVVNTHVYESSTGRLQASTARTAGGSVVQDFTLNYDQVGNVLLRVDKVQSSTEQFEYDALNRITVAARMLEEPVIVSYDPLGNILSKSKTGAYQYCDSDRTKVLCGLRSPSGAISAFKYDAAGNMVQIGDKRLAYDGEGRVTTISDSWSKASELRYGADGELIHQESRFNQNKFEVTYLGDTELVREAFAPPLRPTPERTRLRHFISAPTGTVGFFEYTFWHFPFRHTAPMYGMLVMDNPLRSSEATVGLTYFIKDQLGTLRATLNEAGEVTERFDFDSWGQRRQHKEYVYRSVRQGFTGHEHLDNLDLIHMGGRVYSPSLARFVSPDPVVQFVGNSQSHNRYSYVLNNPLRFVDATGFDIFGDIGRAFGDAVRGVGNAIGGIVDAVVGKPLKWIGEQLNKAGQWLQQNWRTVAVIAATIALGPAGTAFTAFLTGAAIGGLSAALYGGSFEDIMRGAILGGVTASLFYGVGDLGLAGLSASAAHGVAGGVSAAIRGDDVGSGFLAAFVTRSVAPGIENLDSAGYRIAGAAVVGGVTSSISGGSFENGAITGAFSRAFNDESHLRERKEGFFDQFLAKPAQVYSATEAFVSNRDEMIDVNVKGADKYFHCKANCEATLQGDWGRTTAEVLSFGREASDFVRPDKWVEAWNANSSRSSGYLDNIGRTYRYKVDDYRGDMDANRQGRSVGDGGDCAITCQKYRVKGLR